MSTTPPRVFLVCGATGQTGSAAVTALLEAAASSSSSSSSNKDEIKVLALVRDPTTDKAVQLQNEGAILVKGDYSDVTSLHKAFQEQGGVHGCFLCCANQRDQVELETNVIDAAEASGTCQYLVKVGTCGIKGPKDDIPDYTSANSFVEYGRYHAAIEDRLARCVPLKLAWTCLRPNNYMQNHAGDIFGTLPKKMIVYPHTTAKATIVDTRDVGEIGAKLLLLPSSDISKHAGKCYDVCGPQAWSINELASLYASVLGTPIRAVECDPSSYQAGLVMGAGFPEWLAQAITTANMTFWATGAANYESSPEVKELHPQFRTMEEWVKEMAPLVKFEEE